MSRVRIAVALLMGSVLAMTTVAPVGADGPEARSNSHAPTVKILRPAAGAKVGLKIPYGALRVSAFDADVGTANGAGINRVVLTIRNTATGKVVRQKTEYWAPYDFGFTLPDGNYRLIARAKSTSRAGGTSRTVKRTITVDNDAPDLAQPRSVARRKRAEAASLDALNRTRASAGAPRVKLARKMSDRAYAWSLTMNRTGFRHSSSPYAENIAWHSDDGLTAKQAAKRFNSMWVNSPRHYSNMTNRAHKKVGIGLARTKNGWYATHMFD